MYMLWVPTDAQRRRPKDEQKGGGVPRIAQDKPAHALVYNSRLHMWKCAACLRTFRFKATAAKVACKPLRSHKYDIAARSVGKGHVLWRAEYRAGPRQVIFCSRCGCYAEQRTRLLRDRCAGSKTARSCTFREHWEAGRHPQANRSGLPL